MNKDVKISIKAKQVDEYGEVNKQDFFTIGKFFRKRDTYFLFYKETEVTGMEGTTTRLKVESDMVTLSRVGTSVQKQVFNEGQKHQGKYVTPYGNFLLSVYPSKVDVNLTEEGGSINLEYELEMDGQKISFNTLLITVREEENGRSS